MNPHFSCTFKWLILFCLLISTQLVQAKMYRWVDEYGNIFYADKVPPEHNKYKRDSLNTNARTIETTEAEKPKDEKILNKRLARLRKQQQKVLDEQVEQDNVLLKTFRNEDDMARALNEKILSIQSRKKVSEGNLNRLYYQLQTQQKKAAKHEVKGKKVPKSLLQEISATEQQIILVNKELTRLELITRQTEDQFNKDIKRFLALSKKRQQPQRVSKAFANKTDISSAELGLYICTNKEQCNSAWEVTRLFIRNHSSTEIELDNTKLILTSKPVNETDISLSASKIKNSGGQEQIFLDIKCHPEKIGKTLCLSTKVRTIRADFAPFIDALLSTN